MSKTIRKLRPCDYWYIGEHESWFADMANDGLHLKKMGLHFAQFNKGEPKKVRYRIDVSSSKEITPEQKQMYAESGWDYVTSYGKFNVFSSPVNRNAPELHTDPAEQSYTMKELDTELAFSAILVVFSVILIVGIVSATLFLGGTPVLRLVEGSILAEVISMIIMIYAAYTSLQATISIRNLQKTLLEGIPINHNAPWKKHQRVTSIIAAIYILIAISICILPLIQPVKMETRTLPLANTGLPIVSLADIEQYPKLVRKNSSYTGDNIDWDNRYSYNWSLLAPIQYESDEHGIVSNEMWKDGSGEYSPSIHTRVYKLNFPFMAEDLIHNLVKKYGRVYEDGDFLKIDDTDFDFLIVQEKEEFKQVFASKGKAVIYVRYYGYADLDSVVKAIAEKITLITDIKPAS